MRRWGVVGLCLIALAALAFWPRAAPPPRLLVDADEVFPEALAMIRGAKREVLLGMYLLGGHPDAPTAEGRIGWEIVEALAERAEAGVAVRVINQRFEALPDRRVDPPPGDPWFHPVFEHARSRGLPILDPCVREGAIDHTKHLIVDGETALFGGMNLADAVASNHDVMLRVRGPLVGELRDLFGEAWVCAAERAGSEVAVEARGAVRRWKESCPATLSTTTPTSRTIRPALLEALASTGEGDEIRLAMLILTDEALVDALIAARGRGAIVRVLLDPNAAYYGVDCQVAYNAAAAARLAEGGVEVRLFDAAPGQELHMKALAVRRSSGEVLVGLGSANWTKSAMEKNWETYALFPDCPPVARRLWSTLGADWKHHARPIPEDTLALWADEAHRAGLKAACRERLREASFQAVVRED